MNIIELYIDGELCDTGKDFGVRLNRQLLKPSELNAKDAQYSYSISLPPTAANNAAFSYSIIEETKDKFNRLYAAELYVNSVRVFKGNFKLSEISEKQYKGNLYIPAAKSIKDIFGDLKLAENPEYRIEFKDFAEYITRYNNAANNSPQMAIFPYVLYGVIPKVALASNPNEYSPRNIWDDSVRMGIQDFAPSINVLKLLKHIFDGRKRGADGKYIGDKPVYKLEGTAFDDERLAHLYMSYKNENDYVQPWNYGQHAVMSLKGSWSNIDWSMPENNLNRIERSVDQTNSDGYTYYSSNILDSTRVIIKHINDPGHNILSTTVRDTDKLYWNRHLIRIPVSGFYKIKFKTVLNIDSREDSRFEDPKTGTLIVSGYSSEDKAINKISRKRYEVKLLRDFKTGDFGISNTRINKQYYRENQNQDDIFNVENSPKYFPYMGFSDTGKENETMLIDPEENPNLIVGMSWGDWWEDSDEIQCNPRVYAQYPRTVVIPGNKVDEKASKKASRAANRHGTILAAKSGLSWNASTNRNSPPKVALNSLGYMKYGIIGKFQNDLDAPNIKLDESNLRHNVYFDAEGILKPSDNELGQNTVLSRKELIADSVYLLAIPKAAIAPRPALVVRLYNTADPDIGNPKLVTPTEDKSDEEYDIYDISTADGYRYMSLEISFLNTYGLLPPFDISTLTRFKITDTENDIVGWEKSNKYKINLDNAPENYARIGWSKGVEVNPDWNAEGEVNAVVWLDAGENITIATTSDQGKFRRNKSGQYGWINQNLDFELDITPFRTNEDWLQINSAGNGTGIMNWNDPINFDTDTIDLIKFLPVDVKTDDFIENFCKAFNLILRQTAANTFSLDIKQTKAAISPLFINLDSLASVRDRTNSPLGLPSMYKIGFTVDKEEEGYVMTGDDGGGSFETGAVEESVVEQKSNFSYNWFKDMNYTVGGVNLALPIPVISKAEVWADTMAYPDAMNKRYTSLAARFWYYDGLLNDLGAGFTFNKKPLKIAKVSNILENRCILNYKKERLTILEGFFTLLIDASSHYTEIEGFLTSEQYEQLDGAIMAMFNGDQYYVAEISGYDPLGKNRTKIKLIRRI